MKEYIHILTYINIKITTNNKNLFFGGLGISTGNEGRFLNGTLQMYTKHRLTYLGNLNIKFKKFNVLTLYSYSKKYLHDFESNI